MTVEETIGWWFVELTFGTVVRSTILAAMCAGGVWLLRNRTAEIRFRLWRWMLVALLAMPLLLGLLPPLRRPSRTFSRLELSILPASLSAIVATGRPILQAAYAPAAGPVRNPANWIVAVPFLYLVVALFLLARLAYNLHRLRQIANRSEPLADVHFRQLAQEVWLQSGASWKPQLATSPAIRVPLTFDSSGVRILLPLSWTEWDDVKLRTVLTHEMAHVRRQDSTSLLLASFATCVFWFHPLSWFIGRELSALAEEACDETAVAGGLRPKQYAQFLIDFARDLKGQGHRIAFQATAMAQRSQMKRRIERLFADSRQLHRGQKLSAAIAFAIFIPATYLVAAARFDAPQTEKIPWPRWEQVSLLSPVEIANLQQAVQANPEDLDARMELLVVFGMSRQEQPFAEELLWFVIHHPDTKSLSMAEQMLFTGEPMSQGPREQINAAWERAMAEHPDSPAVLSNAATFLQQTDAERGLEIWRKAAALDRSHPGAYGHNIAVIYAAAELAAIRPQAAFAILRMNDDSAARIRKDLESSDDPALLAPAGRALVDLGPSVGEQANRGLELIQRAIDLDPVNPAWKEALLSAQAEPQRKLNYREMMRPDSPQRGVVHIGAAVAGSSLVSKAEPVYPPVALSARVQGSVEFTVTVGPEGTVQNILLVRGHPLLVNAAKDAVLKSVYHPTLQDGKAVSFVTQVIVPFRLPE